MLKRLVIENYRSCLRTLIDFHPNLSVLIGPNGSGKTNILQAIMFLHKLALEERIRRSPVDRLAVSSHIAAEFKVPRVGARLDATIYAHPDESNNDVMLASRQKWQLKSQKRKFPRFEFPMALAAHPDDSGLGTRFYYRRDLFPFRRLGRLYGVPPDIQKSTLRVLSSVVKYCRGIRYYGASQFTNPGSSPASFEIEEEKDRRTLSRQRGHARTLYNMYSAKRAKPNDQYLRFFDIVGPRGLRLIDDLSFREVKTSSAEYTVRVGGKVEIRRRNKLLVIPRFRIGKQLLSPNQLSEGTFKTLALLFHVMTESSTALLIEEPEVCVHHGLLSSILEVIKSYSLKKQMIVSTHSDYVLDQVSPENVYQVTFDKIDGTLVTHVPESMSRKELDALRVYLDREGNLGEYWRDGGLGDV
jgi:ABC-type lipoprotein export system ATPase subunit